MRELESPECTIFQVAFQNVITKACAKWSRSLKKLSRDIQPKNSASIVLRGHKGGANRILLQRICVPRVRPCF